MLAVQSCSPYPSFPSPDMSSSSSFDNRLLNYALDVSPGLLSQSRSVVEPDGTSADQSSIWDSEKTASCNSIRYVASDGTLTSKSSAQIRKEIATLEAEIIHLERYLLSLYRTAFEECLFALSNSPRAHVLCKAMSTSQNLSNQLFNKLGQNGKSDVDPSQTSTPIKLLHIVEQHDERGGFICESQTLPSLGWTGSENQRQAARLRAKSRWEHVNSGHRSLADYLGFSCLDSALKTPDRLSEDILRCISSVYCKLAIPVCTYSGLSASPTSLISSSTIFSSQNRCYSLSPCCNVYATAHQGLKEENKISAATVEVLDICLDDKSFNYAAIMLKNLRFLVQNLEKVDPNNMKREEKLAFWINIHNALVMHAYLAYGTHNRVKVTTILKAAYNVGGQWINADVIQSSILGIRSHLSAPWLQTIFSSGMKSKLGSDRHPYALEYPEPLVHFAICSGAYSDPVIGVYNAKSIFQDLRLAKVEFIQASVSLHKDNKIFLPRVLHYYAKEMSLSMGELLDEVGECLFEVRQEGVRKCKMWRLDKSIHWVPQSSSFRFVIHGELG